MSSSKTKNIIIIVLLILNAILLSIMVYDAAGARRAQEAEVAALETVMAQRGIKLSPDIDFLAKAPASCTILRDSTEDDKLIAAMIGESYKEDMGGNIMFYSTDVGQAVLRGTGEMDLVFNEDLPDIEDGQAGAIVKYMRQKGIDLELSLAKESDGGSLTLELPCRVGEHCVYNAVLRFTLSDERLMMINGTRVFDGKQTEKSERTLDCVDALMSFVDIVRNNGYICSTISGAEAGYYLTVSVSGESSLRPVWRISTDTGTVFINAVSGKMENVSA